MVFGLVISFKFMSKSLKLGRIQLIPLGGFFHDGWLNDLAFEPFQVPAQGI